GADPDLPSHRSGTSSTRALLAICLARMQGRAGHRRAGSITLQFLMKCLRRDTKNLGGARLVVLGEGEGLEDQPALRLGNSKPDLNPRTLGRRGGCSLATHP